MATRIVMAQVSSLSSVSATGAMLAADALPRQDLFHFA